MRRNFLTAGLVVLASVALLGGCVPKAQYDKLVSANAAAQDQLKAERKNARNARKEAERLQDVVTRRESNLEAAKRQFELVSAAYEELKETFDELSRKYRAELERDDMPGLGPLPVQVDRALRRFADANADLLEYLPEHGMVKLKSDLTFASGSDQVRPGATEALRKLVEILQDPVARKLHVYIAGHTDNVPISKPETRREHKTNWHLSVHRAIGVKSVLTAAGLDEKRIAAMGFGEHHPVVPNPPNRRGEARNRRVEIWIVPANRFLVAPAEMK